MPWHHFLHVSWPWDLLNIWVCRFMVSCKLRNILAIIFSTVFFSPPSLLFYRDSTHTLGCLKSYSSLMHCLFFLLFHFEQFQLLCLQVSIFSSMFNLIPSSVFFSEIIVFISRCLDCFLCHLCFYLPYFIFLLAS